MNKINIRCPICKRVFQTEENLETYFKEKNWEIRYESENCGIWVCPRCSKRGEIITLKGYSLILFPLLEIFEDFSRELEGLIDISVKRIEGDEYILREIIDWSIEAFRDNLNFLKGKLEELQKRKK